MPVMMLDEMDDIIGQNYVMLVKITPWASENIIAGSKQSTQIN